ncbi:MAG: hypothetical protein EHM55_22395, partial [Acidobacteria bacterium]
MIRSPKVGVAPIAHVIPARFEEQVAASRERVAVSAGGTILSYGALNECANRIARVVHAAAPGAETIGVLI